MSDSKVEWVRRNRQRMRGSPVYKSALAVLQALALFTGHVRPAASTEPWAMQAKALMPHDPRDFPASRLADVASHIAAAMDMDHPLDELHSSLPPDILRAAEWITASGSETNELRKARLALIAKAASELLSWSSFFSEGSPEHIRGMKPPLPHYALFSCIGDAIGWPDELLFEDLILGAPCVGVCPDSGVFRADDQPASVQLDEMAHGDWNRKVASSLFASGSKPDRQDDLATLWERTQKEVRDGWASPIGSVASVDDIHEIDHLLGGREEWRCSMRFGVWQKGKLRPCDNCRDSLHNAATTLFERLVTDTADFPARAAALFSELVGDAASFSMLLGTEDIEAAYRRVPCRHPQYTIFAQLDPSSGRVFFFRLQGFNFGLKSAVVQFNRIAHFICRASARLLPLCASHFFDDFAVCEPSFARGGQFLLRGFADLLGFSFAGARVGDGKSVAAALSNTYLGVVHDFSSFFAKGQMCCYVSAERVQKISESIDAILDAGSFAGSRGAAKLCGQLQFSLCWSAYRFGRAALQPIYRAQSYRRSAPFTDPLRRALVFLRETLADADGKPRLRPRVLSLRRRRKLRPILVWTDAMWSPSEDSPARIGFVVYVPNDDGAGGSWYHSSLVIPEVFMRLFAVRTQYIGQLELLAAVAVYYSMPEVFRGRRVLHFIDNASALAAIVKGYSSSEDSARVVHSFWALVSGLSSDVWMVYVRSEANVADMPSRGDFSYVTSELGSRWCDTRLPPIDSWGSVAAALDAAAGASPSPAARKRARR